MILDRVNLAAGAIGGAVVAAGLYSLINTVWLLPRAREQGKNDYIAERAVEDLNSVRERNKSDAEVQKLSDYDLCVRGVRGVGELSSCDIFLRPVRP